MVLADVVVALSRPEEAGNIGAVCRAMKNMGLRRLRVIAPPLPLDNAVIRSRAVHAQDLWDEAGRFASLETAVADCALVVGATRRMGRRRKAHSLCPDEVAALFKRHPGPAALVFGNERTGLEDQELRVCSMSSHIPADAAFPSLNLSHAVQIYAYELFKSLGPRYAYPPEADRPPGSRWVPLDQEAMRALVRSITGGLESVGFYKQPGRDEQERFFQDIFSRAGITLREGQYLGDIFSKALRLARFRGGSESPGEGGL